jgi:hypothetical protein
MHFNASERRQQNRWAIGIILAIVLQALAFSFWAGQLQGTVSPLVGTVDQLRRDLSAHMNHK